MPAVAVNDQQRSHNRTKEFCRWIRSEIANTKGKSLAGLAREIGITKQSMDYHLKNFKAFDQEQVMIIFKYLGSDEKQIINFMKMER